MDYEDTTCRVVRMEYQTDPTTLITDRSSFDEAAINDLIHSQDAIALKIVVGDLP